MRSARIPLVALLFILGGASLVGAEPPASVEVHRMPFGDAVAYKGLLVPSDHHAVKPEFKAYRGELVIAHVHPFGEVLEGAPLIRFRRDEYDAAMERLELDLHAAHLSMKLKERAFERRKESVELDKLEAERRFARAKDDYAFFREADEQMRFEERESGMQARRDRIENQREELAQLEKMYGEDDLTEETEEIVLKRARRSLQRAEKGMKFSERRHQRWLKKTHARSGEDRELAMKRAELALRKVRETVDSELAKTLIDVKKSRLALDDLERKMKKLRADEAQFELKAPISGLLHPGAWGRAWTGHADMTKKLQPGKTVRAGQTLMTVIPKGPLHVETTVAEKELLRVEAGLGAGVVPVADPSTTLRARVTRVSPVAEVDRNGKSSGRYAVTLAVEDVDARLRPGMRCEGKILLASGSAALVVPASAVTERGGQTVVYVLEGGKAQPVAVVPGKALAGWVSIDKGLEPGQRVVLDPAQGADDEE